MRSETRLAARMCVHGLTESSLAERSGVPVDVVRAYMAGEPGNMAVWTRLASAMGVLDVTEIVGRYDDVLQVP